MEITTTDLEQFEADGFVHLHNCFTADEVAEMGTRLDTFIRDVVPGLNRRQAMFEDYGDPSTLKQLNGMEPFDSWFAELLARPDFVRAAGVLMRDEAIPQHATAFMKPAGSGAPTPAHQDGYYFHLTPNEALTIWIPTGDIDYDTGALCYIRGSHRKGVIEHGASGVLGFSQGLTGAEPEDLGDEVVCAVRAGDCLIHHSLTVHYAPGNTSNRPRRSLGMVYYAARAREDKEALDRANEELRRQHTALGLIKGDW